MGSKQTGTDNKSRIVDNKRDAFLLLWRRSGHIVSDGRLSAVSSSVFAAGGTPIAVTIRVTRLLMMTISLMATLQVCSWRSTTPKEWLLHAFRAVRMTPRPAKTNGNVSLVCLKQASSFPSERFPMLTNLFGALSIPFQESRCPLAHYRGLVDAFGSSTDAETFLRSEDCKRGWQEGGPVRSHWLGKSADGKERQHKLFSPSFWEMKLQECWGKQRQQKSRIVSFSRRRCALFCSVI